MATTTKQLTKKQLQTALNKITAAENEKMIEDNYERIKKKYVGKCFKIKNRSGGFRRQSWITYVKVLDIKPEDIYMVSGNSISAHYRGICFETTAHNLIIVEPKKSSYIHGLGKEIPQAEFDAAFKKMTDSIVMLILQP